MSETTTYISEIEDQVTTPEDSSEQNFPRLDGELMPLVLANADVIAACPWLGGLEVTISEAMLNYYRPMTENIAGEIIAEVHGLLANRKEVSDESEVEEPDQSEEPDPETAEIQPDQEPVSKIEKAVPKAEPRARAQPLQPQLAEHLSTGRATSEINQSDLSNQPEIVDIDSDKAPIARAVRPASEKSDPQAGLPIMEMTEFKDSNPTNLPHPDSEHLAIHLPEDQETILASTSEVKDTLELLGYKEVIFNSNSPVDIEAEFSEEVAEVQDYRPLDLPPELEDLEERLSLVGTELPTDEGQWEIRQPELQLRVSDGTELSDEVVLIPSAIDKIADALILVVDHLENSEPELALVVNDKLSKIEEVVQSLESGEPSEIADSEAQTELRELFIEIFEALDVDYTPELIESLSRFTVWQAKANHFQNVDSTESADLPQDYGTHEVIFRLLAGSYNVKKVIENASAIGKPAVNSCIYDFPTELRRRLAA